MTNHADLIQQLSALLPTELGELADGLKTDLGIEAPTIQQQIIAVGPAPTAVEQTEFSLELISAGVKKVNVIKVVRELTKLGLLEAKTLVERAPVVVLEAVSKDAAEIAQEKLRAEGAETNIK